MRQAAASSGNAAADNTVATGWLGKGCGAHGMRERIRGGLFVDLRTLSMPLSSNFHTIIFFSNQRGRLDVEEAGLSAANDTCVVVEGVPVHGAHRRVCVVSCVWKSRVLLVLCQSTPTGFKPFVPRWAVGTNKWKDSL